MFSGKMSYSHFFLCPYENYAVSPINIVWDNNIIIFTLQQETQISAIAARVRFIPTRKYLLSLTV